MYRSHWTVAIAILTIASFAGGTDHKETAKAAGAAADSHAVQPAATDKTPVQFTTPDLHEEPKAEAKPVEEAPVHNGSTQPAVTAASVHTAEPKSQAQSKSDAGHAAAPTAVSRVSDALDKLLAGNKRYTQNLAAHPNQGVDRRINVAMSQKPFAVILACADSRVAPEVVFDQGLGDLFVVRVAGNVADPIVLGSIEYAVEHLGASLVVVMGHERCGAVHAAVTSASAAASHGDEHGKGADNHIGAILAKIAPAAEAARKSGGDITDAAIRLNIDNVVTELKTTPGPLSTRSAEGKLTILGARYDLDTGIVDFHSGSSATTTTQVDTGSTH